METFLTTIKQQITEKISSGAFMAGRPLPSCRNLAHMFDSGASTVSTALRELVHENIVVRHPSKKYYPKIKSTQIEEPAISTIIAIGTDYFGDNHQYYKTFTDVIECECRKRKKKFLFHRIRGLNLRAKFNSDLRTQLFDPSVGVLVLAPLYPHDIAFLSRSEIPFVVLNNYYSTDAPCIIADEKSVSKSFVELAIQKGHKDVGVISVGKHKQGEVDQVLFNELREQCKENGLTFNRSDILVVPKIDTDTGKKIERFFRKSHKATMFMVGGDELSLAVKEVLAKGPDKDRYEMVNNSDSNTGIFSLNICKPTESQVKLAIKFLVNEELPEKKVIHTIPKVCYGE